MIDILLKGVLRMPYEMAMANELSRRQYWDRAQQALDELTTEREKVAHLEQMLAGYAAYHSIEAQLAAAQETIEQQAAALAEKDAALVELKQEFIQTVDGERGEGTGVAWLPKSTDAAIAIKPCTEVLRKVKADALREAAKQFCAGIDDDLLFIADRIQRGEGE